MVLLMAKKEAKKDGRSERFKGVTESEIRAEVTRILKVGGALLAIADEMRDNDVPKLLIDGRNGFFQTIEELQAFAKEMKGLVEAEKMSF